jgi:ABC-type glycerol-3-phosphate transport system permease component
VSLKFIRYTAMALIVALFMFPVYWVLTTSLKTPLEAFAKPPALIFRPTFENYQELFSGTDFARLTLNSIIAAVGNTVISIILGTTAAWGMSRYRIGGNWLFIGVLSIRFLPVTSIVIPLFLLFVQFRLIDTFATLPLAYLVFSLPFVIWMMRAYIDGIPYEIEESAMVDGASRLAVIWRIVIPLAAPGLVPTIIFCFIFAWNELVFATVLTRVTARTAVVGLTAFASTSEDAIRWGLISAAAMVVMSPPMILAFLLRRHLAGGLTIGAIKH